MSNNASASPTCDFRDISLHVSNLVTISSVEHSLSLGQLSESPLCNVASAEPPVTSQEIIQLLKRFKRNCWTFSQRPIHFAARCYAQRVYATVSRPSDPSICLSLTFRYVSLCFCLSNALHSSIGQNIKSHPCPLPGLRSPVSVFRPKCEKTSNGHNSATRHPIYFVFGSRLGFLARIALFNLTAHELHELYYDRPTS